ncbi:MAG TPA: hypothetical protein V6D12_14205 [Candidatus Obscuribacterales bacterium]
MAVAEIQKFREKYPQYNDLDDMTIAGKLSQKYPDAYGDLVGKVKSESKPQEKFLKPILPSPEDDTLYKPGTFMDRYSRFERGVAKDILTVPAHFINQFALNYPRDLMNKAGFEYPEKATSPVMQGLAYGAGVVGGFKNPLFKSIQGAGFLKKAPELLKTSVAGGGTAGAYSQPTEDRLTSAGIGFSFPFGAKAVQKGGEFVGKFGKFAAKNITGITDDMNSWIKTRGIDRVLEPTKQSVDYVKTTLLPRAYSIVQENIKKFSEPIQKFAESKGIAPSAIKSIKTKGVDHINVVREQLGDSTDPIYQRILSGIETRNRQVEDAYEQAFSKLRGRSAIIPMSRTKRAMGKLLRKSGYFDAKNRPTKMAENDISENSVLRNVLGFYQSLDIKAPRGVSGITPFQWNLFRNTLSRARGRDKSLSGEIKSILDSLHTDAEKGGLKGIKKARQLARENFAADDFINDSLIKEKKLDRYHKLSEQEKRTLKAIEDFTGVQFIDDLDSLVAAREIDKLTDIKLDTMANELQRASDPKNFQFIKQKYQGLFGDKADEIFDDIKDHIIALKLSKEPDTPAGLVGLASRASAEITKESAKKFYRFKERARKGPNRLRRFGQFSAQGVQRAPKRYPFSREEE